MRRAESLRAFGRPALVIVALAFVGVGLGGAFSYWEAYYQHRGFTPPRRLAQSAPGRLETVHFYSEALRRRAEYLVYLPAGYSTLRRYPVMYLLHGSPGRPQLFFDVGDAGIRLDNLISQGAVPSMILVALDGRIGGSQLSDSEWANTPSGDFESYVVEAVHDVDRRFATIAARDARVIAGYSEGAYGALNIALHHPRLFGAVQVWSGYFTQPNPAGVFRGTSRAVLAYNSPQYYVSRISQKLKRPRLKVFIYGGRSDPATILIAPMVRLLRKAHVAATYAIYPGGHDWQLWNAHFDQMLELAGRDVRPTLELAARTAAPATGALSLRVGTRPAAGRATATGRATQAGELVAGLLLALLSAAAINLGFLLQHRGLRGLEPAPGAPLGVVRAVARNRTWLGGQALGWAGFAAQIAAVTIAPLSLVQSFAAGGLALSVPLAAGLFGQRISRRPRIAVLLVALGLAALPLGLHAHGDRLAGGRLAAISGVLAVAALAVAMTGSVRVRVIAAAPGRAIAAGVFYGIADAAIKAISVRWSAHGARELASGWTVLAAAGTFAGFICFQAALRVGSAVAGISLMNCLAAVVALASGLLAFSESLGRSAGVIAGHLVAIGLVLACVPILAGAHTELAGLRAPGETPWEQAAEREQAGLEPRPEPGHAREELVA